MIEHAELLDELLLIRRPHFQLHGNNLFWIGSKQPRRQFSELEAGLWNLMRQPVAVKIAREKCGNGADTLISGFLQTELCELLEPDFPLNRRRVLVIEPHADDAALSIGGTMWSQRLECDFLIATMASRSNHTRYRDMGFDIFDVSEVTEIRRLESELFARLVGGTHVSVGLTDSELHYHDANWTMDFFRRHRMSIRVSTSRIADNVERQRWTDAVRQLLAEHPSAEVWFPLGGPHTDHLLTADACFAAFLANPSLTRGRVLRVYGEFPYMARYPQEMQDAVNTLRKYGAVLDQAQSAIGQESKQKRRLAAVYDSQEIEEMLEDSESGAGSGNDGGTPEALWTLRELPKKIHPSGILSAATTGPAQIDAASEWAARNRATRNLRVLLLMPTGQWAGDLEMLFAAFPHAQFEVYVATTGAAEVADPASDRIDVHVVASGAFSWIFQSIGIALAMKACPTLFHAGRRRLWQARFLSKLWPRSDTLIVESMNPLVSALRVDR